MKGKTDENPEHGKEDGNAGAAPENCCDVPNLERPSLSALDV
jgi:hypothetical protein